MSPRNLPAAGMRCGCSAAAASTGSTSAPARAWRPRWPGCDAVVDASNAQRNARAVLVDGCGRLLAAEAEAGVAHHVCVSIVGCDQVPMGYYKVKTEQEAIVAAGPVPWSIVQATQFHELAATALAAAARFRILPVPRMQLQTIAAAEVARAVAGVVTAPPVRGRVHVAGPQLQSAAEVARTWRRVTRAARAARAGAGAGPPRPGAARRRPDRQPAGHSRHDLVRRLAGRGRGDLGAGGEGTLSDMTATDGKGTRRAAGRRQEAGAADRSGPVRKQHGDAAQQPGDRVLAVSADR